MLGLFFFKGKEKKKKKEEEEKEEEDTQFRINRFFILFLPTLKNS